MHIAYSAFQNSTQTSACNQTSERYRGYLAACRKHRQTIKDIQQYLPGWEPPFLESGVESQEPRVKN